MLLRLFRLVIVLLVKNFISLFITLGLRFDPIGLMEASNLLYRLRSRVENCNIYLLQPKLDPD